MKTVVWMAIPLTQGLFALVDDEDYEWLNQFKWCAEKQRGTFYAKRGVWDGQKYKTIYMHRQILRAPPHKQVDHQKHNGLDNRKTNIRLCTRSQQQHNRLPRKNTSSKFKGITWVKNRNKWEARIGKDSKQIRLGYFDNEIEATKAYDQAAKELFGEFANCNFK